MNQTQVIETLKTEAKKNPAVDAVLHMFALRQRARHTVTLDGLEQRMKLNGFSYESTQYADVLKLLADLGIGKVEKDAKGRVKALKDVGVTLQSIGKAAVDDKGELDKFKKRNRFSALEAREAQKAFKAAFPAPEPTRILEVSAAQAETPLELTVSVKGHPVTLKVAHDFTAQDLIDLINRLK